MQNVKYIQYGYLGNGSGLYIEWEVIKLIATGPLFH